MNVVWTQMECDNVDFFEAYRLQLLIREQVFVFNELVNRQHKVIVDHENFFATAPSATPAVSS